MGGCKEKKGLEAYKISSSNTYVEGEMLIFLGFEGSPTPNSIGRHEIEILSKGDMQ